MQYSLSSLAQWEFRSEEINELWRNQYIDIEPPRHVSENDTLRIVSLTSWGLAHVAVPKDVAKAMLSGFVMAVGVLAVFLIVTIFLNLMDASETNAHPADLQSVEQATEHLQTDEDRPKRHSSGR